jgi:hypothetical protein
MLLNKNTTKNPVSAPIPSYLVQYHLQYHLEVSRNTMMVVVVEEEVEVDY